MKPGDRLRNLNPVPELEEDDQDHQKEVSRQAENKIRHLFHEELERNEVQYGIYTAKGEKIDEFVFFFLVHNRLFSLMIFFQRSIQKRRQDSLLTSRLV